MAVQFLYHTNYEIFRIKYHNYIIKPFWSKKKSGVEIIKLPDNIKLNG